MGKPWHRYVFDRERGRFVGDFESMYKAELNEGFDAWHQSDPRRLDARASLLLLEEISFKTALDLGCGKGTFSAYLKRRDTRVIGVDSSATAIDLARSYFPDIEWVCAMAAEYLKSSEPVDLIVARELLSYLEDWREVVEMCSRMGRYLLVGLYVPPDPIGFVKSHGELKAELDRHFEVLESIMLPKRQIGTYLCESRAQGTQSLEGSRHGTPAS